MPNADTECLNEYVMVFWGRLADVIYGLYERVECRLRAKQPLHCGGLDVDRD